MKKFLSVLTLMAVPAIYAHDLYLIPAKFRPAAGEKLVISVHNGDSFPGSEGSTDPRRLKDARLSDGSEIADLRIVGNATHGIATVPAKGSVYASLHTEPKLLVPIPPEKWAAYLKEEGLAPRKFGREMYSKYAKTLITVGAPDASFSKPLGLVIEFVPEVNPATLKAGATLPVQLLFRGKPLAGVQVEKAWATGPKGEHAIVGRTDANGKISVPVHTAGKWRLHAVTMENHRDPSVAEYESFWASLTFEVVASTTTSQSRE